jgi:regulator of sigma E protease
VTVILFFIILAVLVLVHEFGHFFAAKKFGVRVDEFGLGFPPRIWGKEYNGTIYSINWIPFGGFVKIFGENGKEDEPVAAATAAGKNFMDISRWKQVVILAAGVVMNVLFAWILFSIAFMTGMTTGVSESNSKYIRDAHVIVLDALPGAPADKAGLKQGDEILTYSTVEAVQAAAQAGKPMKLDILRAGARMAVTVVPEKGVLGDRYAIGISMDLVGKADLPFFAAFAEGARLSANMFSAIVKSIYGLIHDALLGRADVSQLSGPVGIARLVGDARHLGFAYLLSFTAFISMNLAVLNLVPFPALDGGRILFVGIEAIRRKAISRRILNTMNAVGFCLLIAFMLFVTYKDVAKIWG